MKKATLMTLLIFLLASTAVGAYEYSKLSPNTHFNNLKTISGNKNHLQKYKEKSGSFNLLLMGSDARPGDTASHTDSVLLVHADMNHHSYQILSIPRDTRIYLSGFGYTKLTSVQYISQAAHGQKQGFLDTVGAVSNLTGVPINYYAETNYWGLEDMVNAIGGINMDVPFDVTMTHPWDPSNTNKVVKKGNQFLNGQMVAEVVHERDSVPGTDFGRQQLQEEAIIGIAKKIMEPENITKLPALSKSLSKVLIATNMNPEDMISIGLGAKSDFEPKKQIQYHQVNGTDEMIYDDVLKATNDEVVLNNSQLKGIIQTYFN